MAGILKNVRMFAGATDLTGQSNKIDFSAEAQVRDITTFGSYDTATDSVWMEVTAGIASGKLSAEGLFAANGTNQVDDKLFAQLGGLDAWSWFQHTAEVGSVAYLAQALEGSYNFGGNVGDVNGWKADLMSSGVIARGAGLHAPGTARIATGTGAAVQLGATAAGQKVLANVHVLSIAGTATPSIAVKVQSDSVQAFSGSPEDRVTFATRTTTGAESAYSAAGANADTWYRVSYTITGTGPSFLFLVTAGIGPA